MSEVYITSATRTAVASFNGSLASLPADELGKTVIQESLKRSNLDPSEVDEVIRIPMQKDTRSLNVSVASAIVMSEANRQLNLV